MQTNFLSWLLSTLLFAIVGSVVASGIYCCLRSLEKWNREVTIGLNLFACGFSFVVAGTYHDAFYLYKFIFNIFVPSIVFALVGVRFHQKTGGASASFREAFLLMVTATVVALDIDVLLLAPRASEVKTLQRELALPSLYFDLFLLFASVQLAPFALWAYQNSRLRPSIDRHLEPGEEA